MMQVDAYIIETCQKHNNKTHRHVSLTDLMMSELNFRPNKNPSDTRPVQMSVPVRDDSLAWYFY